MGPQLGPILGEDQKRVKKPPKSYRVCSISATKVADLNDKEIRIIDRAECGFERLLAPEIVPAEQEKNFHNLNDETSQTRTSV